MNASMIEALDAAVAYVETWTGNGCRKQPAARYIIAGGYGFDAEAIARDGRAALATLRQEFAASHQAAELAAMVAEFVALADRGRVQSRTGEADRARELLAKVAQGGVSPSAGGVLPLQIDRVLVLSTAHLPYWIACAMELEDGGAALSTLQPMPTPEQREQIHNGMAFDAIAHGYLVYVGGDNEVEELAPLWNFARAQGFEWVKFDCDASTVDGLPTWDWENGDACRTAFPFAVIDEETTYQDAQNNIRSTVVARFATLKEAEDYIATAATIDPDKVERGGYGIDGPEELIQAPKDDAYADDSIAVRCQALGVDDALLRSMHPVVLRLDVDSVVGGRCFGLINRADALLYAMEEDDLRAQIIATVEKQTAVWMFG